MKGLSFYVSVGSYAGFKIDSGDPTLIRIVLGWVAIAILFIDLDELFGNLVEAQSKTLKYVRQELDSNTQYLKEIDPDSRSGEFDYGCTQTRIDTLQEVRKLLCTPFPSNPKWRSSPAPTAKTPVST
jgi:hypothetical protein